MRIKSYFAGTVEAAMERARKELGDDAVLLHAHPAPPEARHLGVHEVVFGVEDGPAVGAASSPAPVALLPAASAPEPVTPAALQALSRQLDQIERLIAHRLPAALPPAEPLPQGPAAFAQMLAERGFPLVWAEELAREAASEAGERLRQAPPPARRSGELPRTAAFRRRGPVADLLIDLLTRRLRLVEAPAPSRAGGRVVAFSGPAGAGKTSLLVKLAAQWLGRAPICLLTTDTVRIGGAEQLRTYATILGVDCEVADTPLALERAARDRLRRDPGTLLLIDTPGWSPAQTAGAALPWQGFFASHGEIEHHLVLPATLGAREFASCAERFRPFGVSRLALTRTDELVCGGALAGSILAGNLPVAVLGTGPSIPEDCRRATLEELVELTLHDPSDRADANPTSTPTAARTGAESYRQRELTHA